jgi:hypothetical protein
VTTGGVRTWFAGLPAVERIGVTERDVARLHRIATRRRAGGWFLIFAFPSLLAVTVFALLFNGWLVAWMSESGVGSTTLGILALGVMAASLAFLLSLPVSLLLAREAFRRARAARMAILRAEVTRCRGPVEDLIVDRRTWKRLDEAGLLDHDEIEIDVIEDSGILWRVGAVEIEPWLELRRGETTETPEYAWIASRWTRPTELDQESVHFNRRRLSDDEIAELADCMPRLSPMRVAFVVALNALAAWKIFHWLAGSATPIEPLLVTALAVWADVEIARLWLHRHRFGVDLAEGWVALVRMPEDEQSEGITFAEFLPESGAEWTVDGAPAAWRRILGHRGTLRPD